MVREWSFAAVLLASGVLIYSSALPGTFVFDDFDLQETFSTVRTGDWRSLLQSSRPALMLSYVVNQRMSGFEPFAFHLTNILLHVLNAILLWRFLLALFRTRKLDQMVPVQLQTWISFAVPLLFLTSPLQTESVAYVSGRSELLAAGFFVAALWAFVAAGPGAASWRSALLITFLFAGAAGTKQDKITLPAIVLAIDYLLLSGCDWRRLQRNWRLYGLFTVMGAAGFWVVIRPQLFSLSAGFGLPWAPYVLTQLRVHFLYLRLAIWPYGLNADYDITASQSLGEHLSWLALLGLLAIAAGLIRYHRRAPVIVFGVLCSYVVLAPTSSFFPILDYAAERRLYLPLVFLLLAACVAVARFSDVPARGLYAGLAVIALVYSAGTFQRARTWSDEVLLWEDTVEKSPQKVRPWTWLGKVYGERGLHTRSLQAWRTAEDLAELGSQEHAHLLNNLGLASARLKDDAKALAYYARAVKIRPRLGQFRANLAVVQLRMGQKEAGWRNLEEAGRRARKQPGVFILRAQEYFKSGRYAEAVRDYEWVLQMSPENARARRNLEVAKDMLERSRSKRK